MIIETILSLAIAHSIPQLPPHSIMSAFVQPAYAKMGASTSSFRSSSSFSSSSSFRSSSSFSRPSSSFSSRPSVSAPKVSAPKIYSSPRPISAPKIPTPSTPSNNIVRVNKQVTPPPTKVSAPPVKNTIPVPTGVSTTRTTAPAPAPAITRETYIERYNDGGIMGNPWFWMYMFNNNNRPAPQSAPIIVKDVEGESVKVPQSQLIVQKDSHNPLREFAVFSLGGGIGVFVGSRLKSRF